MQWKSNRALYKKLGFLNECRFLINADREIFERIFLFFVQRYLFKPLTTSVPHYIETSQLISKVNQLNGFYMENIFR